MKPEATIEVKIDTAVKELHEALIENINAGKAEIDAKVRKQKAHYNLLGAKQRLYDLEKEIIA